MEKIVNFEDLEGSDLIVNCIYKGGDANNHSADPLKELLPKSGSAKGIRYFCREDNNDEIAYVILFSTSKEPEWPNVLYEDTGIYKYYGDNRRYEELDSTDGNKVLERVFKLLNSGESLVNLPPFFIFKRAGRNRDIKFLGLAAPGNPNIPPEEELVAFWRNDDGKRIPNYVSFFTILDTINDSISREWLESLIFDHENNLQLAPEAWKEFIEKGREGIKPLQMVNINDYEHRNKDGKNILYYGVPGSGKSFKINEELKDISESQKERVLFHPDYTYSDFIGQILPKVENGEINYLFTSGPFTRILEKAFHDPDNPYYLIIEEINRGNAPAIFGDVFQLLDREKGKSEDKKHLIGTSEYSITNLDIAQYIYNNAEFEKYGEKVRIPSNLSIYATMNTSDQNVFTLDTAFQRRWNMEMIENKIDNKYDQLFNKDKILDIGLTWKQFCYGINKKIIEEKNNISSSEDKRMGTYFIKAEDFVCKKGELSKEQYKKLVEEKSKLFSEKVLKYLWDDGFKFSREKIFNTKDYGSLDLIIEKFNHSEKEEKFVVFAEGLYDKLNIDFKTESGEE